MGTFYFDFIVVLVHNDKKQSPVFHAHTLKKKEIMETYSEIVSRNLLSICGDLKVVVILIELEEKKSKFFMLTKYLGKIMHIIENWH